MTRAACLLFAAAMFVPATALAQRPLFENQTATLSTSLLGGVSPQRAFNESADGKAAIARLRAFQDEKTREIEAKNKALETQQQTLQQSLPLLAEDARAQRIKEVEKFRLDLERFIQDAQAEFLGVQREAETSFWTKFEPAVAKVAKAKGLQMIFSLDTPVIAWVAPLADITPDVVKELASQ